MKKIRLDAYLTEHGFFESREKARKAIMAGLVQIDHLPADKPGRQIAAEFPKEHVSVKEPLYPYVSRGGLKLEKGLAVFDFPVEDRVFLDIGASTGGFTDCLLQNGARHVYAVDVGYGQFDWKLREDPRVTVLERTNFRHMTEDKLPEQVDGTVMDVSFISITKLFDKIKAFTKEDGLGIWLIKPQFEAGKEKVGKHGVVRDPAVHEEVLARTIESAEDAGFTVLGIDRSPIKGPSGNVEFLCLTKNCPPEKKSDWRARIREVVNGEGEK